MPSCKSANFWPPASMAITTRVAAWEAFGVGRPRITRLTRLSGGRLRQVKQPAQRRPASIGDVMASVRAARCRQRVGIALFDRFLQPVRRLIELPP